MIIKKKKFLYLLILITIILVTGCWENVDLTEIGLAVAVGLDKVDEEIEVTVQLVKPNVIKAKDQGSDEESYWTFSKTGPTIFSAVRDLLLTINKKVFFRHVEIIVIDEELAKEGIIASLDFFERDQETNRKSKLLIAKGIKAKKVLEASSDLDNIPAMHLSDTLENSKHHGKVVNNTLFELLQCMSSKGFSPGIGVIRKVRQDVKDKLNIKDLEIGGTAIFWKDKLVGWLSPNQTKGYLFAIDKIESGIINLPNPVESKGKVALEITYAKAKREIIFKNNKPVFKIEVKVDGRLAEQQGSGDLTKAEMVKLIEKKAAINVENRIKEIIKLAQKEFKSDIFGFSNIMHKKHLSYWKGVEDDWTKLFCQTEFEVNAKWQIKNSALIKEPVKAR